MKCRECNGILKVESTIVYCTRCGNVVDDAPMVKNGESLVR